MVTCNINILKRLITLIDTIQQPKIGIITSTENELNLLKTLISKNSQGASHLHTMIRLNKKFDNSDQSYEFRELYRRYLSGEKPFPLN